MDLDHNALLFRGALCPEFLIFPLIITIAVAVIPVVLAILLTVLIREGVV